jgi:hypothetical protein
MPLFILLYGVPKMCQLRPICSPSILYIGVSGMIQKIRFLFHLCHYVKAAVVHWLLVFAVVPFDAVISTINSNGGAKELKELQQKAFAA